MTPAKFKKYIICNCTKDSCAYKRHSCVRIEVSQLTSKKQVLPDESDDYGVCQMLGRTLTILILIVCNGRVDQQRRLLLRIGVVILSVFGFDTTFLQVWFFSECMALPSCSCLIGAWIGCWPLFIFIGQKNLKWKAMLVKSVWGLVADS